MSEWIKVSERLPNNQDRVLAYFATGEIYAGPYYGVFAQGVTHWRPSPQPPKRETSFESWWKQQPGPLQGGLEIRRFFHDYITKGSAKLIWDAAIAASKSDDFVP